MKKVRLIIVLLLIISLISTTIYAEDQIEHTTSNLSQRRWGLSATSTTSKALFAGGSSNEHGYVYSNRVDIYDIHTNSWTTTTLSQGRVRPAAISVGDMAYIAGGEIYNSASSVVDIYNANTNSWSTTSFSQPRTELAATALGDNLYFGGGRIGLTTKNTVDIYNTKTKIWTTSELSLAR